MFQSNHHTVIFWTLQFYPKEQIKLHKTRARDLSLQHPWCCSCFLPLVPGVRRVQPCRENMAGRLFWGLLSARFAALAGVTRCPHAPSQAGAGVWPGCSGTAEGEVGSSTWNCSGKAKGPCGRQQESCAGGGTAGNAHKTPLRLPAPAEQSPALSMAEHFETNALFHTLQTDKD